ncbi:hypothetical protein Salat_1173900 [Sesamum alatum]|uniref:Uncharacterized protein n=1 Tax=Sesamum alatum TaxID=300844 RepID=A0AAE1YEF9_9LAMI|nr:hypothetical protein Salat_1173900 [Sesamum alatum]
MDVRTASGRNRLRQVEDAGRQGMGTLAGKKDGVIFKELGVASWSGTSRRGEGATGPGLGTLRPTEETRAIDFELTLVTTPLQCVARDNTTSSSRGRRGRRGGSQLELAVGHKRCLGISIIEPDPDYVQHGKR